MYLEIYLANKYYKSKRKENFIAFISWFSLIGITLGVAVLVIVMSVMNGFKTEIINNILGAKGHVYISSPNGTISNYQELEKKLSLVQNIKFITPSFEKQVMIMKNNFSQGILVNGITYNDLQQRDLLSKNISSLSQKQFEEKNTIILGKILAEKLGVALGDSITVISADGYVSAFGSVPKIGYFRVIGFLNSGMYQYDSSLGLISFNNAQLFFNTPNSTQNIEIFLNNVNDTTSVKEDIYLKIPHNYLIYSWKDNNKYLLDALDVERHVMFLILSLIVLIATFNIVSGLVILVKNKTKDIAILNTIGLSKNSISLIFLFIGCRIGITGVFLGTSFGYIISKNLSYIQYFLENLFHIELFNQEVYFLAKLPSQINIYQIIIIAIVSMIFVIISSIYPALKAAKTNIISALKYE